MDENKSNQTLGNKFMDSDDYLDYEDDSETEEDKLSIAIRIVQILSDIWKYAGVIMAIIFVFCLVWTYYQTQDFLASSIYFVYAFFTILTCYTVSAVLNLIAYKIK